ncbi:MAG: DUF523 domain-containing protein [Deltaproteobacteria bacterium]|nr:DUF523 domain-containing protein [Deltaproteobacteria bacterium]
MPKNTSKSLPSVLVSACLQGELCRYDAKLLKESSRKSLAIFDDKVRWVPICPEQEGGLPTPRPAACFVGGSGDEVLDGSASVRTLSVFDDVSAQFRLGAERALEKAENENCSLAILKARSPSCGRGQVYRRESADAEQLVAPGDGVTAALLLRNGVEVFSEENWRDALDRVHEMQQTARVQNSDAAQNSLTKDAT